MKQKNYANSDFVIISRTLEDETWKTDIANIITPTTITFAISSQIPQIPIKKITWDFGTGNQHKSFTNRKQDLHIYGVDCKYKKANDTTVTIQASVYVDEDMFIPRPIITTTVNHMLKEHYVEPEEFKDQIMLYYKTGNFGDDVGGSIYKIANRLAFAPNFINYTYREEMVGDAVVRMVEALTTQKFDPLKGNPFSYFTKIAFHAFCNRIKKEAKNRKALTDYQNDVYSGMASDKSMPYHRPEHSEGDGFNSEDM